MPRLFKRIVQINNVDILQNILKDKDIKALFDKWLFLLFSYKFQRYMPPCSGGRPQNMGVSIDIRQRLAIYPLFHTGGGKLLILRVAILRPHLYKQDILYTREGFNAANRTGGVCEVTCACICIRSKRVWSVICRWPCDSPFLPGSSAAGLSVGFLSWGPNNSLGEMAELSQTHRKPFTEWLIVLPSLLFNPLFHL